MTRLVLLVVEAARLFCFNATNIIYGKACSKYNKKCLYIIGFLLAYILLVHLDPRLYRPYSFQTKGVL